MSEDNSGRWALRNVERGYFLGSSSDKLTCTAKVPGDAELWHVHLAARPQVTLSYAVLIWFNSIKYLSVDGWSGILSEGLGYCERDV